MARNHRPVSETPLHDSSSEEEEDSGEEEEDSSSSEDEETQHQPQLNNTASTPKKPQSTPTSSAPNKLPPPPDTSDSNSDSEDDSDSDSPPTATAARRADPNIKPIASKPMADPPKPTKKSRPDPTPSTPPPKSAAAAVKRPAAESNGALDSKRAKKKQKEKEVAAVINNEAKKQKEKEVAAVINNEATPKKAMFQRLLSEDDEIAILKGLLEFRAKKGYDPMSDFNAFHVFIKKSLRLGDVSLSKFSARIRRLKKKFENNLKKGRNVFSKPHEQLTYDLSKKLWGEESDGFHVGNAEKGSNGKGKKNGKGMSGADEEGGERVEEVTNSGPTRAIGLDLSVEEVVMKDGLELVGGSKKLEMMEKWRQFRVKEVELYLMRLDLVREQAKLVLEALKK